MNELGNFVRNDVVDFEFPMTDYVKQNHIFGIYTSLNGDDLYEKSWDIVLSENKNEMQFRFSEVTADGYESRCVMCMEMTDDKLKGTAFDFTHIKLDNTELRPAEDSGRGVETYFMVRMISDIANEMGNGQVKIFLDKGNAEFILPPKSDYHDCMETTKKINQYIVKQKHEKEKLGNAKLLNLTPDFKEGQDKEITRK